MLPHLTGKAKDVHPVVILDVQHQVVQSDEAASPTNSSTIEIHKIKLMEAIIAKVK